MKGKKFMVGFDNWNGNKFTFFVRADDHEEAYTLVRLTKMYFIKDTSDYEIFIHCVSK